MDTTGYSIFHRNMIAFAYEERLVAEHGFVAWNCADCMAWAEIGFLISRVERHFA